MSDPTRTFDPIAFYKECEKALETEALAFVEKIKATLADGVQLSDFVVAAIAIDETTKTVEKIAKEKAAEFGAVPGWAKKKAAQELAVKYVSLATGVKPEQIDGTVAELIDIAVTLLNKLLGHGWLEQVGHIIGDVLKAVGKFLKHIG